MNILLAALIFDFALTFLFYRRARAWKRRHRELVKHCAYLTLSHRTTDQYLIATNDRLLKLKKAHDTISEQSARLKRENDDLELRFRQSRDDFHRVNSIMKSLNDQLIDSKKPFSVEYRPGSKNRVTDERMIPSDGKL